MSDPTKSESTQAMFEGKIYDVDDYTFYLDKDSDQIENLLQELKKSEHPGSLKREERVRRNFSCDCSISIKEDVFEAKGRVLACRCFRGQFWSVTFRRPDKVVKNPEDATGEPTAYTSLLHIPPTTFSPKPNTCNKNHTLCNLNSIKEICDKLYELIFSPRDVEANGLLVITGATASAKSQIARGLIDIYLGDQAARRAPGKRRQHLITYEDPIEVPYEQKDKPDKQTDKSAPPEPDKEMPERQSVGATEKEPSLEEQARLIGVDYTPREKGRDVDCLKSFLSDALRQTPAVAFIGEMRDADEWSNLIEFAGSGHLAVTTAHAGSLTEAMGRILRAVRAVTPAQRSEVAERLLAIVHIRREAVELDGKSIGFLLPAIWRYTVSGSKALVADGLTSLLPFREASDGKSSLGRAFFADKLITAAESRATTHWPLSDGEQRDDEATAKLKVVLRQEVEGQAIDWDLEEI